MRRIAILLALLVAAPATALADAPVVDCPRPPPHKPSPPRKVVPPKAPPKVAPPTCHCPPGERGPQGPRGERGATIVVEGRATLSLALGVMGSAYLPHGDWAWGPALQLRDRFGHYELAVDAGLADVLPGRESGYLLHAGVARYFDDGPVGVTAGVHWTSIDGSSRNNEIDGEYLAVVGGLVLRHGPARLELAPALAYLCDDADGRQVALGVTSSLFIGGRW